MTKNDPMRPGTGSLAMWTTPRFPAWPHARAGGSRTLLSAAIRSVYPIRTAAISLILQLLSRLKWSKRHYTATCYIRAVAADVRNAMRNFAAGLCMEVFREFFRASSRGPETTSKKFLYGGFGTQCVGHPVIELALGECIIANARFETLGFWKRGLA